MCFLHEIHTILCGGALHVTNIADFLPFSQHSNFQGLNNNVLKELRTQRHLMNITIESILLTQTMVETTKQAKFPCFSQGSLKPLLFHVKGILHHSSSDPLQKYKHLFIYLLCHSYSQEIFHRIIVHFILCTCLYRPRCNKTTFII